MFGFLKKRAAAPQSRRGSSAAAHAQGPDAPTTPRTPELDRKFADRPTNANVAALVYLYAAPRLLELLVRRGVINFGLVRRRQSRARGVPAYARRYDVDG